MSRSEPLTVAACIRAGFDYAVAQGRRSVRVEAEITEARLALADLRENIEKRRPDPEKAHARNDAEAIGLIGRATQALNHAEGISKGEF